MSNSISILIDQKTKTKVINFYKDKRRSKTPPYAIFQADDNDTVITLYESNKLLFQGPNANLEASVWGKIKNDDLITHEVDYYKASAIGSDEVGTGDYFGPIVVTACYVNKNNIKKLERLGIKDSKTISDDFIKKTVPKITEFIPYASKILSNPDYNKFHNKNFNMNKIKAILHYNAINELLNKKYSYDYIIIDQFASKKNFQKYINNYNIDHFTFLTKAESKNLAVATSSMISRYIFLKEIDKLSSSVNINLPLGSGPIVDKIGQEIVNNFGPKKLTELAKLNFKNTQKIIKD